ncbi:MAG: ParB/RepB/Spo0J family partition protein [Oceanipulchritudo sp.]
MARQTGLGRGLGSLISGGVAAKKAAGKKGPSKKAAGGKGGKAARKEKKSRSSGKVPEGTPKAAPEPSVPEGTRPFSEQSREAVKAREPAIGLYEIPTGRIVPNPHQPRREFREESLKELAESIRAEGLLQPVVVRKRDDVYELVAGERRWRACQELKLKAVPARVIEASETSSAILSLIENLQREDLNPIEEAMGYASLLKDFDLKQEQVAERIGRSRAAVANALRLLGLAREIQGYLVKGHLSVGHAKVLLGVEDAENRLLLARQAIERGWSVRELERRLDSVRKPTEGGGKARSVNPAEEAAIADVQKQLSSAFSTRVYLKHAPKKGRIVIEYYGNDDLQRIMERMGLQ